MNEIKLPPALNIGERYGKLSWSVRGIYEGYVGWFDRKPATVYETPAPAVYPDLVKLAGAEAVAKLAAERVTKGLANEALHLIEIVLTAEPHHRDALETKLKALEWLRDRCRNSNERGWLDHFIRATKQKLEEKK
jgi:alkyl sulfatase BDS1-like metallo-beta-lactamase superfamily hydrolase